MLRGKKFLFLKKILLFRFIERALLHKISATLQYPRVYQKVQKGPRLQVEGVLFFGLKRNIAALREYFSKLTILKARRSFS